MSRKATLIGWVVLLGFSAGVAFFAWTIRSSSAMNMCSVCKRRIHGETRTVAEVDGRRAVFCCPECVRRAGEQRAGRVRILELTDHDSGERLEPEGAFVVVGSDVNYCLREQVHLDEQKQAALIDFDRCAPSAIAFARREAAEEFAGGHGGRVMRADEFIGPAP